MINNLALNEEMNTSVIKMSNEKHFSVCLPLLPPTHGRCIAVGWLSKLQEVVKP